MEDETLRNNYLCFVMTVDVDSWSSLLRFYSVNHDPLKADSQVNIENGVERLLDLFEEHEIKATFFTPGEIARKHSSVVRKISEAGHEVACHGLTHDKDEFLRDGETQRETLREATDILVEASGCQPLGFRAPCLRLNRTTLRILDEHGYLYDSSIISTLIPGYYGVPSAPTKPYHPSFTNLEEEGSLKLLEIPVSVNPLFKIPLSAAWMRNMGLKWVKFGINAIFHMRKPVVFYIHPRDVVSLPKVKGVPWHLYRNVGDPSLKMLDEMIQYVKKFGAKFMRAIELVQLGKDHSF